MLYIAAAKVTARTAEKVIAKVRVTVIWLDRRPHSQPKNPCSFLKRPSWWSLSCSMGTPWKTDSIYYYILRSLALLLKPLMVSLSNHVATPFDKLRVSGSCAQFSNQRKGR
jgi:hypothetical protein